MEMFVLLTGQTRGREGWRCALEKYGELCVILIIIGATVFFVWRADSWDLKLTKEQVCLVILYQNWELIIQQKQFGHF